MPEILVETNDDGTLTADGAKALGVDEKFGSVSDMAKSQVEGQAALARSNAELDLERQKNTDLTEAADTQDALLLEAQGGDGGAGEKTTPADPNDPLDGLTAEFVKDPEGTFKRTVAGIGKHTKQAVDTAVAGIRKEIADEKAATAESNAKKEVNRQGKALMEALIKEGKPEEYRLRVPEIQRRLGEEVTADTLKGNTVVRIYKDILAEEAAARTEQQQADWVAANVRAAAELGGSATPMGDGGKGKLNSDSPVDELMDLSKEDLLKMMEADGTKGIEHLDK